MEASREISRTPRRLPPCSDVSVLQKTRMSHFWDTHHSSVTLLATVRSRYKRIVFKRMGRESSIPVRVGHFFFLLSRISCLL